jgi:hypothetical protein
MFQRWWPGSVADDGVVVNTYGGDHFGSERPADYDDLACGRCPTAMIGDSTVSYENLATVDNGFACTATLVAAGTTDPNLRGSPACRRSPGTGRHTTSLRCGSRPSQGGVRSGARGTRGQHGISVGQLRRSDAVPSTLTLRQAKSIGSGAPYKFSSVLQPRAGSEGDTNLSSQN